MQNNGPIASIEALVAATARAATAVLDMPQLPPPNSPPSKQPRPPAPLLPPNDGHQRLTAPPALPELVVSLCLMPHSVTPRIRSHTDFSSRPC